MPMKSEAQRGFLWAQHPELAREFEDATPKGKKLPEKLHPEKTVKRSHDEGFSAALTFFKVSSEEIRLQIPRRKFHGLDAAMGSANRGEKKADGDQHEQSAPPLEPQADPDSPVEKLTALLQQIEAPGQQGPDATKDPLDRSVAWGAPSNLAGGDVANRVSDMGQPTSVGAVF